MNISVDMSMFKLKYTALLLSSKYTVHFNGNYRNVRFLKRQEGGGGLQIGGRQLKLKSKIHIFEIDIPYKFENIM